MKSNPDDMSIGELAERFDLATHVLRHWESVGVIQPYRRPNGHRRYGREHIARVAVILAGQEVGVSLERLRELVHAETGAARRDLLRRQADELDERIARLRTAREVIEHPLHCPSGDFYSCPDFHARLVALTEGECAPPSRDRQLLPAPTPFPR
ncbi:MerR family transcriptional regulator [Spiractinospora alimapuensis]|uniref:MerR family transcriptional regulator n=1 Tax=Spiractinospora alimapuensis TaxID=2820884 RepID=UPI001F2731ED|nr:MerR family transcriptional regulator [Spiractinospora alimapuensis]QVQ53923.1 MerR family transcriptional regulator [Spiractinospora alimapuensis]